MMAALIWTRRYGAYVVFGIALVAWALLMCTIASVVCVMLYLP